MQDIRGMRRKRDAEEEGCEGRGMRGIREIRGKRDAGEGSSWHDPR